MCDINIYVIKFVYDFIIHVKYFSYAKERIHIKIELCKK